jgi:hypothetical protein
MIIPVSAGIAETIMQWSGLLIGFAPGLFFSLNILAMSEYMVDLTEQNEFLNQTLNQEYSVAKSTLQYERTLIYNETKALMLASKDMAKYTENYAWSLVKYEALKTIDQELQNGTDFNSALSKAKLNAQSKLYEYYDKLITNVVNEFNQKSLEDRQVFNALGDISLTHACALSQQDSNAKKYVSFAWTTGYYAEAMCQYGSSQGFFITDSSTYSNVKMADSPEGLYASSNVTLNALDKTYTLIRDQLYGSWYILDTVDAVDAINEYSSAYNRISANLDAYLNGLTAEIFNQSNFTDILDPVTVATMINNDYDQTGYYAYATLELALLGLGTDLNSTFTIEYDNDTLTGVLLSDYSGTIEKNQTVNTTGYLFVFVDEDGNIKKLDGNFTVIDIRDPETNESIDNTTFVKYVDHSGDIQKIYEELQNLRVVYDKYVELQTTGGGGSSTGWWDSLDWSAKVAVVAIGGIAVYAILRRD